MYILYATPLALLWLETSDPLYKFKLQIIPSAPVDATNYSSQV